MPSVSIIFIGYKYDGERGECMKPDVQSLPSGKHIGKRQLFARQWQLQCFVIAGMIFLLIFRYFPMFWLIIAFKNYDIVTGIKGVFTSKWVGLQFFKEFFIDPKFPSILTNTLAISGLKLLVSFPLPIIFAIMVTETRNMLFRRFVQTASYLPHFISWVTVSGLVFTFFSVDSGIVNKLFNFFGFNSIPFITNAKYYWFLAVFSDVWKDMGWWAIIFIAAITTIDPSLYEAAIIDGAGRMARIRHIVIPGITGAISVVLILAIGGLIGGGLSNSNFEQSMLIGNNLNTLRSEVIQSYSVRMGLNLGRYSYGAAVGMVQSVTSVILIFSTNAIVRKLRGVGLF